MYGALDVGMLLDDFCDQRPIGDVALVKDPAFCKDERSGQQRIQDDRRMSSFFQRRRGSRANVPRTRQ